MRAVELETKLTEVIMGRGKPEGIVEVESISTKEGERGVLLLEVAVGTKGFKTFEIKIEEV